MVVLEGDRLSVGVELRGLLSGCGGRGLVGWDGGDSWKDEGALIEGCVIGWQGTMRVGVGSPLGLVGVVEAMLQGTDVVRGSLPVCCEGRLVGDAWQVRGMDGGCGSGMVVGWHCGR